jgi:hypothetical protein
MLKLVSSYITWQFHPEEKKVGIPAANPEHHAVGIKWLQVEHCSRLLLGETVPNWPTQDALNAPPTIEARFASACQDGWQTLAFVPLA